MVGGKSTVHQISRATNDFLVDFYINQQLITCWQPGNEENEKRLILIKGKNFIFTGTLSNSHVYGHGIKLDDCVINQLRNTSEKKSDKQYNKDKITVEYTKRV